MNVSEWYSYFENDVLDTGNQKDLKLNNKGEYKI